MRFAGNPHLSGHRGGHDTNLRQMAADGIRLVGRFIGADREHATFAPDLSANLQFADAFFDVRFRPIIDTFIERAGLSAPDDDRAWPAFEPPTVTELDLARCRHLDRALDERLRAATTAGCGSRSSTTPACREPSGASPKCPA